MVVWEFKDVHTSSSGGWPGTGRVVEQMSNQGSGQSVFTESWTPGTVSPTGFQEHRMQRGLHERVGFWTGPWRLPLQVWERRREGIPEWAMVWGHPRSLIKSTKRDTATNADYVICIFHGTLVPRFLTPHQSCEVDLILKFRGVN